MADLTSGPMGLKSGGQAEPGVGKLRQTRPSAPPGMGHYSSLNAQLIIRDSASTFHFIDL